MTNNQYEWKCEPKAEDLLVKILEKAKQTNSTLYELEQDLLKHTSSRLFDWVDHFAIPIEEGIEEKLEEAGFEIENAYASNRVYHHKGAQLPRLVLKDEKDSNLEVFVSVDSITDFLMVRGLSKDIEGSLYAVYRRALISSEKKVSLWVIERRGSLTMEPAYQSEEDIYSYLLAKEKWKTRPRSMDHEDNEMQEAISIASEIIASLGTNRAASLILECEREFWQSKNLAGQLQKNRQDRLGMGWANHDHHTFRSSRKEFHHLVRLFEMLGFHCRERYYAGKEAGWGAQIMENPIAKLILFLDVDLSPEELEVDFAHHPIPPLEKLGTIGLWCALHGDSILAAGMHHLEAQFMFESLTEDLHHLGIRMMDPFSSFPYLKQAFTAGEIWPVKKIRVEKLLKENKITKEQAEKFISYGAIGSHLENLQRREGYKGFNQKNVSTIIKKTNPLEG